MGSRIKIAQINAMRSATVMHEIRKVAEEENLDLVCIQEPYTRSGKVLGMPVTSQVVIAGENAMTVVIVFNRDIATTVNRRLSDDHCVCVEIKTKAGSWIIANQYYQFSHDAAPHIEKTKKIFRIYNTQNNPVLVLADANAKSTVWHSNQTDEKGEEIEIALQELGVETINKPRNPPTYQGRAGASSNIDITIANMVAMERVQKWQVKDGITTSDHNMITMELTKTRETIIEPEVKRRKYNLRRADWTRLKAEIDMSMPINEDKNIHDSAKEITREIKRVMYLSIPEIQKHPGVKNKQWTEEISSLRKRVRVQRKRYQRSIIEQERRYHLQAYRELKATYTQKIYENKMTSWDKFVKENLETDAWGIPYKLVSQKIRCPTVFSTMRIAGDGDNYTKNWRESAEILLQSLLPDDDVQEDSREQRSTRQEMTEVRPANTRISAPFTMEEVDNVIQRMKKNKAPGPDGIKAEILQALSEQITPKLTDLFNVCLKKGKFPNIWKRADVIIIKKGEDKDPEDPKSYRPICLINTMGKVLERLMCNRLQRHREETGMHEGQFGYRKGRSTEDAVNKAVETVTNIDSRYVITIFVDISGAFDNLWWPALFKRLRNMDCPADIYAMIRSYCQDRYVEMLSPQENVTKTITKGCPQGSICGPIFWDIMMEDLLDKLQRNDNVKETVAYADDLLLIIEGNTRLSIETKTNQALHQLQNWCKKNKLNISETKTTYSIMKGTLLRDPIIKINNKTIKRSKTTKYLGITLDEKRNYSLHMENTCRKARNIMGKIARLAQRDYKIPLQTIQLYCGTIMASIVSYGASVWADRLLLCKPKAKIRGAQRGILIRLTGAFSTTSLEALCVLTGICPLDITIRKRAASYWLKNNEAEKAGKLLRNRMAHTKKEITAACQLEWQEGWNDAEVGRRTHQFLPNVQERNDLKHFKPTRGLVHFLSGHGPYPTYLSRFNLKEDDLCECGEVGSPEHVVLLCPHTQDQLQEERRQLPDVNINIYEIIRDEERFNILNQLAEKASNLAQRNYN